MTQPHLSQPLYNATFGQAVYRFFRKYIRFEGFASRKEFWWIAVFYFFISMGLVGTTELFGADFSEFVYILLLMGLCIPTLTLTSRRLHDAGFSGLFLLLNAIPFFGQIALLIMATLPTNKEKHREDWQDPQAPEPSAHTEALVVTSL